jgi:putative transposase
VRTNQATFPIVTMCRVLAVSASGYYGWRRRPRSARSLEDAALTELIRRAHAGSKGTYGAPRIHAELAAQGVRIGKKRVARLMRACGLAGVSRRRGVVTTRRDGSRQAPDLVDRNFSAGRPDALWVADISYIPTWAGFLYLAVVLDVFSRRIVGWSMADSLATQLVLDALDMALGQRRPTDVIHHSDQGSQYTSIAFGKRCREADVRPSMGSVGDAYDNAMCESFFATLECEFIDRRRFRTKAEARLAIFSFIEGWYNPLRRHSGLGYLSPIDYERCFEQQAANPGNNKPAGLLAAVKVQPRNSVTDGIADNSADLDHRSAGRLDHPEGRDERSATAEQKKTTTQQEDDMTPTTLH